MLTCPQLSLHSGSMPLLRGRAGRGLHWNIEGHGAVVDRLVVRVNQFNQHFVRTGRQPPQDEGVPLASAQCHGISSTVT